MKKFLIYLSVIFVATLASVSLFRDDLLEKSINESNSKLFGILISSELIPLSHHVGTQGLVPHIFASTSEPLEFIKILVQNGLDVGDPDFLTSVVMFRNYEALEFIVVNRGKIFPVGNNHLIFSSIPQEMYDNQETINRVLERSLQNGENICSEQTISRRDRRSIAEKLPKVQEALIRMCPNFKLED